MSIVKTTEDSVNKKVEAVLMRTNVNEKGETTDAPSDYSPSEEEKKVLSLILKHFVLGTTNSYTPRVEFNDLSLIGRDMYDQMSFNTYQPNNGEAWEGDEQSAWRSRAIRPIVRNKCMSIAAHATARILFPKIFAYNEGSEEQRAAAQLMEDLMEWAADVSDYTHVALMRVITALVSPASIGYTEYNEVTRLVKTEKGEDGKWIEKRIPDEAYPCFHDVVVPVDQIYIENFYQPDIQKQGFIIWRKVISFSEAQIKYNGVYENFKYVRPGVQTIYDDANRTFYYVYDPNMRQEDVEEITYWNKSLDLKIITVNGVMLTECDNPNPRQDKLYPFDKFGYEPINNRFFFYKSLAFKLQQDANIVNTLYQMLVDGTFLSIFKPMVAVGSEIIASDVIVPGAVTTLSSPDADLRAVNVGSDLRSGFESLSMVEKSINESSQEPLQQGIAESGSGTTAFEISRLEKNANTVLGLFIQMISQHVKDFGRLRLGDIIQYLTVPEVIDITGNPELVYKTFFVKGNESTGEKNKKIVFDLDIPDEMDENEYLDYSYDLLEEEKKKNMSISKANPTLVRKMKYRVSINPDVMNPRSSDLERAYDLETFDRLIATPNANQDEALKLLLGTNPKTKKDPEKFIMKAPEVNPEDPMSMIQNKTGKMPASGNSPLAAVMGGKSNIVPGGM